ncbi:MAG TPA: hemolysin family protein [Thermoanaerobaculia bacterium]|nr:hemolysin family protein [Thermoanaerobaculia bacterium]
MIALALAALCFLLFLTLELFAQSLERLSPIKLRSLVEEEPKKLRMLSGKGQAAAMKVSLRVVIQILLLAGFWALIRGLAALAVPAPYIWGAAVFFVGWLAAEALLLRIVAAASAETLLTRLDPILSALSWLIAPIAWPIRVLFRRRAADGEGPASEEDIQAYIDVGREEGILERDEEKLLMSIVDFGDTMVKEVMTPRTDIAAVDEASPLDRVADLFIDTKYSRLPIYRGTVDQIVGIAHVKDVFEAVRRGGRTRLAEVARPVAFVPETKKTAELLREFQRRRLAMAIVVDEYGSVSGLVTIEDLLEEIVGEISDEHEDERDSVLKLADGAYSISGRAHVDVLEEVFGHGPKEEEYDTLGGYLTARLGRVPRVGETREEDGLRFTVEEGDRRRVLRVRVEAVAPTAEGEEESAGPPASPAGEPGETARSGRR